MENNNVALLLSKNINLQKEIVYLKKKVDELEDENSKLKEELIAITCDNENCNNN